MRKSLTVLSKLQAWQYDDIAKVGTYLEGINFAIIMLSIYFRPMAMLSLASKVCQMNEQC